MNPLKHIVISAVTTALFFASVPVNAKVLTPDQALNRATGFNSFKGARSTASDSYQLSYTLNENNEAAVYIFTPTAQEKGYLVVAADDNADALLGYTFDHNFDSNKMPPAMMWWLKEYGRQIAAARSSSTLKTVERPKREPITPMLSTTWNQDSPYNSMCPEYNGKRSVTGCVATAMAQVVKYHQWPETGVGSHQYFYNGAWISLDYSKITFDWANMINSYANGAGTERQKNAVARLMYACGVSVDMNYSPVESGAADVLVASALVDYFNYDKNVRYAERDYFGLLDWEEFIYNQLRDYGPVQYSGSSSLGGHSFVCDGYSEDGFFHFNWGWGGVSDGYFRLNALDPPMQGIGGANSGYNYDQAVIANIRKPKATSQMYFNLMMDSGFNVVPVKTTTATKPGDQITVDRRIINYSIGVASGSVGVKFTNRETGEVKYGTAPTRISLQSLSLLSSFTTQIPSTLRTGTYDLTPVMCGTDGIWKDIPVKLSTIQRVVMTIKGGTCSFEAGTDGDVNVDDVTLHTPVYLGNLFRLTAKATNPGDSEFVGQLVPTLASGNTPVAKSDPIAVDLLPGESMDIDFTGIFNHFASSDLPSAGKYTLYIVKEATNQIVSKGIEVQLNGVPENTKITVSDFALEGDPKKADRNNLVFKGKINCQTGYFGRNLTIAIFPYSQGQVSSLGFFNTPNLFIGAGENSSFSTGGVFGAGEPGKTYFAAIFDGQSAVTASGQEIIFTLENTTGVDDIQSDINIIATRVYTPAGVMVLESGEYVDINTTALTPGLYIIETVTDDGKHTVAKQLKLR